MDEPFYLSSRIMVVPALAGVLEKLRVRTIGLKDVRTEELSGKPLPLELFVNEGLRTKE